METYKVLFNPETDLGAYAISHVEDPAIKGLYVAMNNLKEQEIKLATVSEEKRIVVGPVLVPDLLFERVHPDTGKRFNAYFDAETISAIHENIMAKGYQNNSTLSHNKIMLENVSFKEMWIKEDDVHDKSLLYGLDYPKGTLFAMQKVNNDELWNNYIKTGKVKGFSIDAVFDLERINLNSNYMDFEKLGSSIVDAIQKGFSTKMNTEAPAEITQEPVTMATMMLEDGVTVLEATSFEVGSEVNIVAEDGSKTLAPEGKHKLEDGTTIVVDANGLITEVMPAEIEVEVETEMSTDAKFEALIKSVITNMSTEFGVQLAKVKTELSAEITALKAQKVELTAETKAKPQTNNEPKSAFEKFRNFNKQFN
jgi:hypothetical protein